jgi:hypothetical protein
VLERVHPQTAEPLVVENVIGKPVSSPSVVQPAAKAPTKGKNIAGKKRPQAAPAPTEGRAPAKKFAHDGQQQQQQLPMMRGKEMQIAIPSSSAFNWPVQQPPPPSSGNNNSEQQQEFANNPDQLNSNSQFDLVKFMDYLTSNDAHYDIDELYKICSDPSIVNRMTMDNNSGGNGNILSVTSGGEIASKDVSLSAADLDASPEAASLMDIIGGDVDQESHDEFYRSLEEPSDFQSLDTPLVEDLD